MLFVNKNSVIYILTPANAHTGGPEAEHQLASQITQIGIAAKIVYVNHGQLIACPDNWETCIEQCSPTEEYLKYHVDIDTKVVDNPDNVLIVPEIYAGILSYRSRIQNAIWWLAVPTYMVELQVSPCDVTHLFQAEYIKEKLKQNDIDEMYPLSDYTRENFLKTYSVLKKDLVVYNPAKGREYTQKILDKCPTACFVPIQGMTPEQVHKLLLEAKVYIDFGHHPGKDRIPREAAISGCCVVVGKRGSAQYFEDVPIAETYKIETKPFDLERACNVIQSCLEQYEKRIGDFAFYRNHIRQEKARFQNEIKDIFTPCG